MKMIGLLSAVMFATFLGGCEYPPPTTDEKQAQEQAQALEQAHAQVGMPSIGNFSEKRMMKDLYELRDKPFPTHTYIVNEMTGCLMYLGPSVGYGLPYATQYTAPTKVAYVRPTGVDTSGTASRVVETIPQPEPNGLFMPAAAEGTWVMLKSPTEDKVQAVYVEPRVVVSPFRLPNAECPARSDTSPTKH
jgi:hypothetical protein